jgi:hypothetical protein
MDSRAHLQVSRANEDMLCPSYRHGADGSSDLRMIDLASSDGGDAVHAHVLREMFYHEGGYSWVSDNKHW